MKEISKKFFNKNKNFFYAFFYIFFPLYSVFFMVFSVITYEENEFNIINLSNYTYIEYITKTTNTRNEIFGNFKQKEVYCSCYGLNNIQKNITEISLCSSFNCSKIMINENKYTNHSLTKWKKKSFYLNYTKYYYYQGINPLTKECDIKNEFFSCGFLEDIQFDFCVKNIEDCPLLPFNNNIKNFAINSLFGKHSKIFLEIKPNFEKLGDKINFLINSINNETKEEDNIIIYDYYSIENFFEDNKINVGNYFDKGELSGTNISIFLQKCEIMNNYNKNIGQNELKNNFYSLKFHKITSFSFYLFFFYHFLAFFATFSLMPPFCFDKQWEINDAYRCYNVNNQDKYMYKIYLHFFIFKSIIGFICQLHIIISYYTYFSFLSKAKKYIYEKEKFRKFIIVGIIYFLIMNIEIVSNYIICFCLLYNKSKSNNNTGNNIENNNNESQNHIRNDSSNNIINNEVLIK